MILQSIHGRTENALCVMQTFVYYCGKPYRTCAIWFKLSHLYIGRYFFDRDNDISLSRLGHPCYRMFRGLSWTPSSCHVLNLFLVDLESMDVQRIGNKIGKTRIGSDLRGFFSAIGIEITGGSDNRKSDMTFEGQRFLIDRYSMVYSISLSAGCLHGL
jgi:hypothetical protein